MADILQTTNKKLEAVLAKIDSVAESGFSQPGPEDALAHIRDVFTALKEEVELQRENSAPLQKLFCRRAVEAIDAYLPILGFISRASDLDGPVELHGPLWDLTVRALGPSSKLIISPEWDYSPLTILFPQLSDLGYVLVGLPGCEASNALLTPLAGHELGHNIWAAQGLETALREKTREAIVTAIIATKPQFVPEPMRWDRALLSDLDGEATWAQSWHWLLRQCEEAFCDAIGLLLFRESFLHAGEYLLTPTLISNRNLEYPSTKNRVAALTRWSNRAQPKIQSPADYEVRFDAETPPVDEHVQVSDHAFPMMVDELFDRAQSIVGARNLVEHDTKQIAEIQRAFEKVVPAINVNSLSDIVNAGWRVYLENPEFVRKEYPNAQEEPHVYLNELVLKTIEVLEIERRTKTR